MPCALREDADGAASLEHLTRGDQGLLVGLAAPHRIGAEAVEDPAMPSLSKSSTLAT
jgi:hypothetical protein